ncbi:hypothetical protein UlMin_007899 [Ulmus minor]
MDHNKPSENLKFLCSYNGKILPRHNDGKLRYVGGLTRVLAVDRSVSYAELMVKLGEFCGFSVNLKCQLPGGDLETLISITSDEDLANLIEEYDRDSSRSLKIRAILLPRTSIKKVSPPPSVDFSTKSPFAAVKSEPSRFCSRPNSPPFGFPVGVPRSSGGIYYYPCHVQGNPNRLSHQNHHYHNVHHCNF